MLHVTVYHLDLRERYHHDLRERLLLKCHQGYGGGVLAASKERQLQPGL